jgi:hypothetical protein
LIVQKKSSSVNEGKEEDVVSYHVIIHVPCYIIIHVSCHVIIHVSCHINIHVSFHIIYVSTSPRVNVNGKVDKIGEVFHTSEENRQWSSQQIHQSLTSQLSKENVDRRWRVGKIGEVFFHQEKSSIVDGASDVGKSTV